MPLLELRSLCKFFGGVQAAKDVSLTVAQGEIHGLIGPNGSGKTTVFNCLTGVYRPTMGDVIFNGQKTTGLPPHRVAKLGMARTFQNLRLFSGMTVIENIMVGRHLHQVAGIFGSVAGTSKVRRESDAAVGRARELTHFCGLEGREDDLASSLPYGLQRRLEIARALATEPKLLLLDEPAAGMNPSEAADLKKLIVAIRDSGVTVFLIEHNVRLVMGLCDRVTVMESGGVIADDVPEGIIKNPKVIEAYLGTTQEER